MNRGAFVGAVVAAALVVGGLVFITRQRPTPASPPAGADVSAAAPKSSAPGPRSAPPAATASPGPRRPARPAPPPVSAAAPPVEEPELGTLHIETDVPGAQVFIDRQFIGTAPLTAERVKPGTHRFNVTAEGFDGIAQSIDVEPGPRDLSFRLREVRLDAVLAVVHKHRIGSCRGKLVATVDGLRYETDNHDDAFSVPLQSLETFQVDYQEKNLRIKLKQGKQYNFTDPDGNADRLFVFHRDVERARARLAGTSPADR